MGFRGPGGDILAFGLHIWGLSVASKSFYFKKVNSDSLRKVEENMRMVRNDYKQIKEENEQLIEKLAQ